MAAGGMPEPDGESREGGKSLGRSEEVSLSTGHRSRGLHWSTKDFKVHSGHFPLNAVELIITQTFIFELNTWSTPDKHSVTGLHC